MFFPFLEAGMILTECQLNSLVSHGILESYEPMMDIPGSYSAQFEHVSLMLPSKRALLMFIDGPPTGVAEGGH